MLGKSFIISNEPTVHTHSHTYTHTPAENGKEGDEGGEKEREILHLNQTFAGPS